jgi:hypothetical protein
MSGGTSGASHPSPKWLRACSGTASANADLSRPEWQWRANSYAAAKRLRHETSGLATEPAGRPALITWPPLRRQLARCHRQRIRRRRANLYQLIAQVKRLAQFVPEQVELGFQRDGRGAMPEPPLDLLDVGPPGEQKRRAGVAIGVESRRVGRPDLSATGFRTRRATLLVWSGPGSAASGSRPRSA